ncbi:MAG: cellulase family glycosylhydrolase [Planctomycetes bacterium]|nr:cellulase family glycosylhydrolase [Planctomycetota bacterium]
MTGTLLLCALGLSALQVRGDPEGETHVVGSLDRGKGWYGRLPGLPGDERFKRVYVKNATLYHDDDTEVALWGVNLQSAMSGEFGRYRRILNTWMEFDAKQWKAITDRSFDEIQTMGCDVIRIHLCPADLSDADGNLVANEWLDMVDYTMAECRKRGIYVTFALFNHWGGIVNGSPFDNKHSKWAWMVVPEMIAAGETYIRQFVNRKNPYDSHRPYKNNPAWIIAELMNEPVFPTKKPASSECPKGVKAYEAWRSEKGKPDTADTWRAFRYEAMKAYINRMDRLLYEEKVPAVPCWNLYWSKGPKHQGWEGYNAAADSTIPVVSFSTYPGQDHSRQSQSLHDRNYLPYLEQSYQKPDFQGWLRQDRFRKHKARIVYEYETWHNQSTYMYPAMAKYFRAQGAQIATMWTYNMSGEGTYMGKDRSHNLSLITTPRKAASFLVAREVFLKTPRYTAYSTTEKDADRFGNAALSLPRDLSAYGDEDVFVHTGTVDSGFIAIPEAPTRIIGYGSSPLVEYEGRGLYFLEAVRRDGALTATWTLKVLPHAEFTGAERPKRPKWGDPVPIQVTVDHETALPMKLRLPGLGRACSAFRLENGNKTPVPAKVTGGALALTVKPGEYLIERQPGGK